MKKEKLLTILGPTAVGKTELSVYLAKILGSSIISGDAFQVYRGMDIFIRCRGKRDWRTRLRNFFLKR